MHAFQFWKMEKWRNILKFWDRMYKIKSEQIRKTFPHSCWWGHLIPVSLGLFFFLDALACLEPTPVSLSVINWHFQISILSLQSVRGPRTMTYVFWKLWPTAFRLISLCLCTIGSMYPCILLCLFLCIFCLSCFCLIFLFLKLCVF